MKRQTLAACVCAAITLGICSCGWFGKKHTPQASALMGTWQVTGIKDSTQQARKFGSFFFDGFNADSTKIVAAFYADSILITSSAKESPDTIRYYVDSTHQKIFIMGKTHVDSFSIITLNDSLLQVVRDSVYIKLKKQP